MGSTSTSAPPPRRAGPSVRARSRPSSSPGPRCCSSRSSRSSRSRRSSSTTIRALVWTGQASALAFVVVEMLGQNQIIPPGQDIDPLFGHGILAASALLAAALALVPRWGRLRAWIASAARERPLTRIACAVLATAFAATWLIELLDTDRLAEGAGVMDWTLNDAFAVLDGHDPLVDYHLIYGKLLPYPEALALLAFGATGVVFTLLMAVLSLFALLAVYGVLRRVTRSSLLALCLFVAFVALSDVGHTMLLVGMWPTRYGGAYLMAWLVVRHVDGAWPRRPWVLFLAAGLVTIDDLDFGAAATAASVVALLCAQPPRSRRDLLRLGGAIVAGLAAAVAAVSALTLARAGALPSVGLLLEWPRIFTDLGWFSLPMPTLGLHLVVYATFVAAIGAAAVRVANAADDRLLTAMLAWSGIFGLLAGSYYAGRSEEIKLETMYSTWAFALAALAIACLRALAARGWRRPTVAELLVLFGVSLAICTVKQMPRPGPLISRLTGPQPRAWYRPLAERFVRPHVTRGEKVAILLPEGHRIAWELGVDNVSPYPFANAIVTRHLMSTLIDTLDREHVHELFMPAPGYRILVEAEAAPEQVERLEQAGFTEGASRPGMLELRRP